jgi:hypothetical protein
MVSFSSFRDAFLRDLASSEFGEEPDTILPGSFSPAAKELREKKADIPLSKSNFLKSIHQMLNERERLAKEQAQVRVAAAELRPVIVKLRSAQKTMATVEHKLGNLIASLKLIDLESFYQAIERIKDCRAQLRAREGELLLTLHPSTREKHWIAHGWEPVVKPFKYSLRTLRIKAPDQWLFERMNSEIMQMYEAEGMRMSQMTRYRIMFAIFKAVHVHTPAITIKQYFQSKKNAKSA